MFSRNIITLASTSFVHGRLGEAVSFLDKELFGASESS
jgi:hypothetical protein